MSIRLQADTDTRGVSRQWFPEGKFGTIELGRGNRMYFDDTADIDELIAELVALRQEMDPPTAACPAAAPFTGRPCTEAGEHEFHHAGIVTWTGPGEGGILLPAGCDPDTVTA